MSEVYRARDTRLDRTVAVKILPHRLADRPDLRERFAREAKTIASLNHPGKWQISTEGGNEPVGNRNGRELFYRNGAKMMAVDITTQASLAAGTPRVLFERQYPAALFTNPKYDVSPDGQRFLMVKQGEQAPAPITIVQNWIGELKRGGPDGRN